MPEHLRALFIILVLSTAVFAFAHRPACAITAARDYTRRRNLWFSITLAAFLAHSFWVYTLIATLLLIYANRRETNPPALYFFILFALPAATIPIPGMGLINYFFDLSHARILALFILLPVFFALIRRTGTLSFGRTGPDKVLAAYLLLTALLYLRETSVTDTLRQTFYLFIDVFLPYFIISRSLKNLQAFRDALLSLVLAIMVVALFAAFEAAKQWLLYQPLLGVLGLGGVGGYLMRDGILRALVTTGQPIALGYLMVTGMGFYLFLQRSIRQKLVRRLGMALLAAGLIAPLSRGPWVGAAVLFVVFIATGRDAIRRLMILALAAMFALPLVAILPGGEKVINLLPFIGSTEKGNITYREDLITNAIIVIKRNPWFGSVNYLNTPEMEAMRQGQGIIDIVNSYIGIALETGLVGLTLFVGFFILTLQGIYRAMRSIPDRNSEERLLGRTLLATLLAILIMIFTVSSITIIPMMYWSVAGLGVAYAQMVRKRVLSSGG
ncbi:ligase [Sulfuricella sp. T08]|uniref:O-antigen ligase family protein n=1 Tax=Sulfuricella sp. T08 TaxID=1632857 RepID=UPI00061795EE|nr:O-antigen ligase family protein [Sulfuricella sp. T08]GAO34670.1 ligase [Sulfuricella sp. T08]